MEIIEELEEEKRGLYGGSIGYFSFNGNMDMCIAIRTMIIKDKRFICRQVPELLLTLFQRMNMKKATTKLEPLLKQ